MIHHFHRTFWVHIYSFYPWKTFSLDYENSEDVPDDCQEQYYEEPDLSRGVGVDYGIIYGTSDKEPDTEAYNYRIDSGA
jgi:hypothetical protein